MTETVLIYATKRQRKQLTRQGIEILTEYEDYVLAQATQAEVTALQANGYEVEIYAAAPAPPTVSSRATSRAATIVVPHDSPARIPSSRVIRRAIANASRSLTRTQRSMTAGS